MDKYIPRSFFVYIKKIESQRLNILSYCSVTKLTFPFQDTKQPDIAITKISSPKILNLDTKINFGAITDYNNETNTVFFGVEYSKKFFDNFGIKASCQAKHTNHLYKFSEEEGINSFTKEISLDYNFYKKDKVSCSLFLKGENTNTDFSISKEAKLYFGISIDF